jgi:hypothetical protein
MNVPTIMSRFLLLCMMFGLANSALGGFITEFTHHSSFVSAATKPLIDIGFDEHVGGAILDANEYRLRGMSMVHRDGGSLAVLSTTFGFTSFHPLNLNTPLNGIASNIGSENIDFVFETPATSVGLWIGNLGDLDGSNHPNYFDDTNGTLVQIIGTSGTILAEEFLRTDTQGIIQGLAIPNNRIFYGAILSGDLAASELIDRIRIVEGDDGESVVFDNIQFDVAAVPEPGCVSLLASIACLWFALKNKAVRFALRLLTAERTVFAFS